MISVQRSVSGRHSASRDRDFLTARRRRLGLLAATGPLIALASPLRANDVDAPAAVAQTSAPPSQTVVELPSPPPAPIFRGNPNAFTAPNKIVVGPTTDNRKPLSPYGALGRAIWGDDGPWGKKISLLGWGEVSAVGSSNKSKSILPAGFLNSDTGFSLNQAALVLCSGDACPPQVFGPSGGVYARIGPFPGPRKDKIDIGFNVTAIYGEDAQYFLANGFDTKFGVNKNNKYNKLALPQAFLDVYLPIANGTRVLIGNFFTPIDNEIGLPFNPPNWFVTRTYAFEHGPGRHFGVLAETRLNTSEKFGLLGISYGLVNGWNTQNNPNSHWDFIGAIRYRSPDMKTSVEVEGIYGDGNGEENSGYFTLTTNGRYLKRYDVSFILNHQFSSQLATQFEFNYGHHDGGDIAPLPIFFTKNAHWLGANFGIRDQISRTVAVAARVERFTDAQGANVTWAGSPGSVWGLTANAEWLPNPHLRVRPEIRYDTFNGRAGALPLFDDHRSNDQLIGLFSVFVPF